MKKMKLTPSVWILLILVLVMLVGNTYAMYVTQKQHDGTISLTAQLGNIALREHKVTWKNQAYVMDHNTLVTQNDYALIPGISIPKDTYVEITNKSTIAVYVYLEIVGDSSISYGIDTNNWQVLAGVTGANGGTVYVYKDIVDGQTDAIKKINIFQDQQIRVKSDATPSNERFVIHATMYQTAAGNTVTEIYQHYNPGADQAQNDE